MGLSVVIPAHNEERVIARGITALLDGLPAGAEVVVVCNGCDDRTAAIARSFGAPVAVVDIPVASKSAALNAGDEAVTSFPRFYVDADVVVTGAALATVAAELERPGGPLAAAPRLAVDLAGCSWAIRAYYRIWTQTPYVTDGLVGSGVYGLSAAGRARFDAFPPIIADDLFVHRQFAPDERASVPEVSFTIHPPRQLRHLARVQTRRRAGIAEHARLGAASASAAPPGRNQWPALVAMARRPGQLPALAVYLWVVLSGRASGGWKARFGNLSVWEREDSSRVVAPGGERRRSP